VFDCFTLKMMTERLSHKNWIFSNTASRNSDLASKYEIFYFACVSNAGDYFCRHRSVYRRNCMCIFVSSHYAIG